MSFRQSNDPTPLFPRRGPGGPRPVRSPGTPGFPHAGTVGALRLPAARPAALGCLRLAVPSSRPPGSLLAGPGRGAGEAWAALRFGRPAPMLSGCDGGGGTSHVPGGPGCPFAPFSDPGGPACVRPLATPRRGPRGKERRGRIATGLSGLNGEASGLAVYASPGRSPAADARLASGRWSGSAGRASHPQGPGEGFRTAHAVVLPSRASLGAIPLSRWSRSTVDRSGGLRVTRPQTGGHGRTSER